MNLNYHIATENDKTELWSKLKYKHDKKEDWDYKAVDNELENIRQMIIENSDLFKNPAKTINEYLDKIKNLKDRKGCPKCGLYKCIYSITQDEFVNKYLRD